MRLFALSLLLLSSAALAKSPAKSRTKSAAPAAAPAPAPEPPPRGRMELLGAERISGPLTDIEPTIRKQQPRIADCYERQYKKDARLQGVFTVELTIAQNGRVKDLEPTKDSVKSEALSGCIMTTARRLVFPRPKANAAKDKGDTIVRVHINFVPAPPPPPPPAPPPPVATSPAPGSASAPGLRR